MLTKWKVSCSLTSEYQLFEIYFSPLSEVASRLTSTTFNCVTCREMNISRSQAIRCVYEQGNSSIIIHRFKSNKILIFSRLCRLFHFYETVNVSINLLIYHKMKFNWNWMWCKVRFNVAWSGSHSTASCWRIQTSLDYQVPSGWSLAFGFWESPKVDNKKLSHFSHHRRQCPTSMRILGRFFFLRVV